MTNIKKSLFTEVQKARSFTIYAQSVKFTSFMIHILKQSILISPKKTGKRMEKKSLCGMQLDTSNWPYTKAIPRRLEVQIVYLVSIFVPQSP